MSTATSGRPKALSAVISLVLGALAAFLLVWALLMAVSPDNTSGIETSADEVVNYGS
ncbi:hypothetical protein GCM10022199_20050 [Marihabitans asiaticum]|uniref:Uncharacterized protein n=1 Tax=Marihabitans asiaticum TaxID=415218 RepID=A0A560WAW3_9MICO|nr:hypothetical protein [Marihabitans asiaticum]TWD14738.1 hypothetical protein FB557_2163 [Marihabitans asiaticum]